MGRYGAEGLEEWNALNGYAAKVREDLEIILRGENKKMANYELKRHKMSDKIKWIIVFLLIIGLIATTVTLFVKVDRQTTVTEIGAECLTFSRGKMSL